MSVADGVHPGTRRTGRADARKGQMVQTNTNSDVRRLDLAYYAWSSGVTDFEATCAELAEAGVRSVVVDANRGNLSLEVREDAFEAKRILDALGLAAPACHGLSSGACHLTEEDAEARARMIRGHLNLMENAALLGSRTYVIHIGPRLPGEPFDAARDRAYRALDDLAPRAESLGLLLALENGFAPSYLTQTAEDLLALVAGYGSPAVGICYDSGHAHLSEGAARVLDVLRPQVVTVHLHDNNGAHDEHLVPGQGTIDWSALVPLLSRCPRLAHVETEAANCESWPPSAGKVLPVRDVYATYCRLLNRPESGLCCR